MSIHDRGDGCSYYDCGSNDDLLKKRIEYLINSIRLGYEWLIVLTATDCQKTAKNMAAKLECLGGAEVAGKMGERELT